MSGVLRCALPICQRGDVNPVLAELGIDAKAEAERLLEVWNKIDLLDDARRATVENEARRDRHQPIVVSSVTGAGVEALLAEIERRLNRQRETIDIAVGAEEGSLAHWIYENCEVLQRSDLGEGVTGLRIRVAPEKRHLLVRLAGPARLQAPAE